MGWRDSLPDVWRVHGSRPCARPTAEASNEALVKRFFVVLIATLLFGVAPAAADTNADLTRIVRSMTAAAPANFESFAIPPPKAFGGWAGIRRGIGLPLFDSCGVGKRRSRVMLECLRMSVDKPLYPTRRAFVTAMKQAMGPTFVEVDCSSYRPLGSRFLTLDYISCYRDANGTEVSLLAMIPSRDTIDYDDYGFDIAAPPDAPDWRIDALKRLYETTMPLAASAPRTFKHVWLNVATGNAAGDVITVCYYTNMNGHTGVACDYGNDVGNGGDISIATDAQLVDIVRKSLPSTFQQASCTAPKRMHGEPHRFITCFRNSHMTVYVSQLMGLKGLTFSLDFLDDRAPETDVRL